MSVKQKLNRSPLLAAEDFWRCLWTPLEQKLKEVRELNTERSPADSGTLFQPLPQRIESHPLGVAFCRDGGRREGWEEGKLPEPRRREKDSASPQITLSQEILGQSETRPAVSFYRTISPSLREPWDSLSWVLVRLSSFQVRRWGEKKENLHFSRAAQSNGANISNPGTCRGLAPT